MSDSERNRLSARAARYARVGANVGGVAARMAGARLFGLELDRGRNAVELAAALGGLKGPIMKVAQLHGHHSGRAAAGIRRRAAKLQSQAPPMGWAFVKRRMMAELGAGLAGEVRELRASAGRGGLARPGASRASRIDGAPLACKLQYPDMQSAVEADLQPARSDCSPSIAAWTRRSTRREIAKEIGARVREELDYRREAKHAALYRAMLGGRDRDPRAASGRSFRPAGC